MLEQLRVLLARIWLRLLAFNILLVFLPMAAVFALRVYEVQLLDRQEQAMAQQGRLISASLGGEASIQEADARELLRRLEGRTRARLRVLDEQGMLLADTSILGPQRDAQEGVEDAEARTNLAEAPEESWLYRLGAFPFRFLNMLKPNPPLSQGQDFYSPDKPFDGPEVRKALGGAYGADTRLTQGQRSLTLYSAIPIRNDLEVIGVALVSQSTYQILRDLYEVRLSIFKIFLGSLLAALVLSLLVGTTIASPLRRLRDETGDLLDARGRLTGDFAQSTRRDEIGDLTRALRALASRLAEYQEKTRSFAADLSHEFKNPLASIRSATDVLGDIEDPREQLRFVAMIQGDIARLERLLSSLRDVSTIDAGADTDESEVISFVSLCGQIVDGWRERHGKDRDIVFKKLPKSSEHVAILTAPHRFGQVIDNLLDNAASFSPAGAPIEVALETLPDEAVVRIRDHGPGIPEEHIHRVFDRFFSYRPEDARGRDHSGLGLAIVRAIIESYGGRVEAENAAGGGAQFTVRLPRVSVGVASI